MVDARLLTGLGLALLLHAAAALWASGLTMRPPMTLEPVKTVRTVRQDVKLPKPPPPPPPKEEPKPEEPKLEPQAPKPQAEAPKPQAPKRSPQPKSNEPPPADAPPPSSEPAPLVLSKTYGGSGDSGVAVQTGDHDTLGDPAVDATEENTRRRREEPKPAGTGGNGTAPADEDDGGKVEIVHAVPKGSCRVEWPEGAEVGHRTVEVRLSLEIGLDGRVKKARILRGAGEPFDDAAIEAVQGCAFQPGTRDGKPFVDRVPFLVVFKPSAQ